MYKNLQIRTNFFAYFTHGVMQSGFQTLKFRKIFKEFSYADEKYTKFCKLNLFMFQMFKFLLKIFIFTGSHFEFLNFPPKTRIYYQFSMLIIGNLRRICHECCCILLFLTVFHFKTKFFKSKHNYQDLFLHP